MRIEIDLRHTSAELDRGTALHALTLTVGNNVIGWWLTHASANNKWMMKTDANLVTTQKSHVHVPGTRDFYQTHHMIYHSRIQWYNFESNLLCVQSVLLFFIVFRQLFHRQQIKYFWNEIRYSLGHTTDSNHFVSLLFF